MNFKLWLFIGCLSTLSPSCKHGKELSEKRKMALNIQKETDLIAQKTDSLLLISKDTLIRSVYAQKIKEWKSYRLEIADHDHSNCTHDHKETAASYMTDDQILETQQVLKDSIDLYYKNISSVVNE